MNNEQRNSIGEDIINAANTCNQVVALMQSDSCPRTTTDVLNVLVMAMIGINQALVAIAEVLACGKEKDDE